MAERVFDRCLSYGAEKNPERLDYEITFDYEYLDDTYARSVCPFIVIWTQAF